VVNAKAVETATKAKATMGILNNMILKEVTMVLDVHVVVGFVGLVTNLTLMIGMNIQIRQLLMNNNLNVVNVAHLVMLVVPAHPFQVVAEVTRTVEVAEVTLTEEVVEVTGAKVEVAEAMVMEEEAEATALTTKLDMPILLKTKAILLQKPLISIQMALNLISQLLIGMVHVTSIMKMHMMKMMML